MQVTGISRKIDEVGRVVIPKDIRQKFNLLEGDEVDFIIGSDKTIMLKKSDKIAKNKKEYQSLCNIISEQLGMISCMVDETSVVVSGDPTLKNLTLKKLSAEITSGSYDSQNGYRLLRADDKYIVKMVVPVYKGDRALGRIIIADTDPTSEVSSAGIQIINTLVKFIDVIEF